MKYLLILCLFLAPLLNAGSVSDNANILGPKLEQLESQISSLPIFIESHEHLDDPRVYADTQVKHLTNKGFLIVVTTNPRKWRISMTPERVVSGESTRLIGDQMMIYFKRGDYCGGLLYASIKLNESLSEPIVERAAPKIKNESDNIYFTIFIITIIVSGIIVMCWGIHKWVNPSVNKYPEAKNPIMTNPLLTNKPYAWESVKTEPVKNSVERDYIAPARKSVPKRSSRSSNFYDSPAPTNSSSPDYVTPLVIYSALNNTHHSDDNQRKSSSSSSSSSTDYSSYDSSSSSSFDSSSSSSDSGGSSGGDW